MAETSKNLRTFSGVKSFCSEGEQPATNCQRSGQRKRYTITVQDKRDSHGPLVVSKKWKRADFGAPRGNIVQSLLILYIIYQEAFNFYLLQQ